LVDIKEVAENIYLIDDCLYSIPKWGSVYLINEEKKVLIDSGPATSAYAVLDGIKDVGVRPDEIDYIIVTHVHLDHAGGAGVLIKDMPKAQVIAHHRGARHLVNPEKLIRGTIEFQGEDAMAKHGEVVSIEAERVKPAYEGDVLTLGERQTLEFIDAPGHAPHELCIYESRNNGVFTGDAAGISIADNEILMPASQPPNFDLELYINTLERLMKLKATRIYFAHFGASNRVQKDLQSAIDKLKIWDDIANKAVAENGFDCVGERIMAQVYAELEPIRGMDSLYEHLTRHNLPSSVAGYIRYYQNKQRFALN